jgi:hypothetical protein
MAGWSGTIGWSYAVLQGEVRAPIWCIAISPVSVQPRCLGVIADYLINVGLVTGKRQPNSYYPHPG